MSQDRRRGFRSFYEVLDAKVDDSARVDDSINATVAAEPLTPKGLNEDELAKLSDDLETPFETAPQSSNPILPSD